MAARAADRQRRGGDAADLIIRPTPGGYIVIGIDGATRHELRGGETAATAALVAALGREAETRQLAVLDNRARPSGLGNLRQAEGTVGLQRAFLARGARSVLVSLWSVSDEATEALMKAFYRHWLDADDAPTKAEALRRAQEDVRASDGFSDARYWAAFQLVGGS